MDIIKLAEEAGLAYKTPKGTYWIDAGYPDVHLERFAELVAAEEREECARLCEDLFLSDGEWCAKSIRARNVSTKSQNVDTSEKCVHESDKSIHKPWVSLTDEEIDYIWGISESDYKDKFDFPRKIEAKLKEKNA